MKAFSLLTRTIAPLISTGLTRTRQVASLALAFTSFACSSEEAAVSTKSVHELTVIDASQALPVELPKSVDPMFEGMTVAEDAHLLGMWSQVYDWPLNGLHTVLLPNGRVLSYGTPKGAPANQDGRTFDVWDPQLGFGESSHRTDYDAQRVNSFCSGAAFNADGSLLISGGNSPLQSSLFTPGTGAVTTSPFQMAADRWYGSMITLPDGRLLMMGGSGPYEALRAFQDPAQAIASGSVSMTPEIYERETGFRSLFGAYSREAFGPDHHRYWYPRAWVAPNGNVFGISSEKMWELDYSGDGAVTVLGDFKTGVDAVTRPNIGPTSAAVMFAPGRILQVGGNGYYDGHPTPGSVLATIIDINGDAPILTETGPMANARQWPSATVLPDGKVVVTGGTKFSNNGGADAVYAAEIWDPETGTWTVAASAAVIRVYHSAAILMPNGTLLSTGGGAPGPVNNRNAEIFYPPYLFRVGTNGAAELAPRPRAAFASTLSPLYGSELNLDLEGDSVIARAVLIGAGSTTHSFNTSQRFIELSVLQEGSRVAVGMPLSANLAPPGYYQLFLLDDAGVPSPGVMLSLGGVTPPSIERPLPRGGEVTFEASNSAGSAMATDAAGLGILAMLGEDPTPEQLLSAKFIVRDGLADASCVSFESVAVPGRWLRHYGYRLRLGTNDNSALFKSDATFCPEKGLGGRGFSFRSQNFPQRMLRHKNGELWIDPVEATPQFQGDATFVFRKAPLPVIPPIVAPIAEVGVEVSYAPQLSVLGASYAWDFGDGSAPTPLSFSPNTTHTYAAPGVYLVTLSVTLSDGRGVLGTFVQAVHRPVLPGRAQSSSQVLLSAASELWVANPDSGTVSVFDAAGLTKLAEIPVGAAPESVAISPSGDVWVAARDDAKISIIFGNTYQVSSTFPLPPGSRPSGVVFSPVDEVAYVSLDGAGEVLELDAQTGAILGRAEVGGTPRGLAVTADGSRLFVSRFVSPPVPGENTTAPVTSAAVGEVRVLDLPLSGGPRLLTLAHSDLLDGSVAGRGVPNYLGAPVISPDGRSAWVPSKQDNIARGVGRDGLELDFQNTVRAIASRVDLESETEVLASRVDLDNSGVASAAAFHPTGAYLFVALETSREVAVLNAEGGSELFRVNVGRAPQALTVSDDGKRLFVSNFMDRSLSVLDLTPLVEFGELEAIEVALLPTVQNETLPTQVLLGKQLFYDAADVRLARDGYLSCASCHADGADDGRVWDLTGFGEGVRNTVDLRGRGGVSFGGMLHWSANFDEVQDFEGQIRTLAGGTGLLTEAQFSSGTVSQPLGEPKAGLNSELDALAAYVNSLTAVGTSPHRSSGQLSVEGARGRELFAQMACNECHYGASYSDEEENALIDVGTMKNASGQRASQPLTGLDVPSLVGVFSSSPYLHDGSAYSIGEAILAHDGVKPTSEELGHLVAFVSQIDASEPAFPRYGCFDGVTNAGETDVDCGGGCAGCGEGQACSLASDCASGICTSGVCEAAPSCSDGRWNGSESDVDCGEACSMGCDEGERCVLPGDCQSGVCTLGLCAPAPSCVDGLLNQNESDVDCGGVCPACPDGAGCVMAVDCASATCVDQSCVPAPSCTDSVQNQNESDVDCGGVCADCSTGLRCSVAADCTSGICSANFCQAAPSCTDVLLNQNESDVDCGGSCASCENGRNCFASTDCASGFCSAGVCETPVQRPKAVWIQAENGVLTGSPTFRIATDTAASGGKYLTPTANNIASPGPNRVTYTVEVAAGQYALWMRLVTPSADDDSFWISVDGGRFINFNNIAASSSWVWTRVHDSDAGGAKMVYNLSAGIHTIQIANREDGVRLDRLYLTQNGDTPNGLGGASCDDLIRNGDETGVDCGGPTCSACVVLPSYVYLEAESAALSGSPGFRVVANGSASGGYAIEPTANTYGSPGTNRARFTFQVAAGTYVIWARLRAPTPDDDSFFVSVDGGPFTLWNGATNSSGFVWAKVHNSNAGGAIVSYNLSAGTHTIEFANREDGCLLDQIYVASGARAP